jgi:hypothetical protein
MPNIPTTPAKKPNDQATLTWELPLGTIRGHLDEPGPRFVDPYQAEERKAIQEVENMMPPLTGKVFR